MQNFMPWGSGNGTDLATAATNAKVAFRNTTASSLTSNEGYTGTLGISKFQMGRNNSIRFIFKSLG